MITRRRLFGGMAGNSAQGHLHDVDPTSGTPWLAFLAGTCVVLCGWHTMASGMSSDEVIDALAAKARAINGFVAEYEVVKRELPSVHQELASRYLKIIEILKRRGQTDLLKKASLSLEIVRRRSRETREDVVAENVFAIDKGTGKMLWRSGKDRIERCWFFDGKLWVDYDGRQGIASIMSSLGPISAFDDPRLPARLALDVQETPLHQFLLDGHEQGRMFVAVPLQTVDGCRCIAIECDRAIRASKGEKKPPSRLLEKAV